MESNPHPDVGQPAAADLTATLQLPTGQLTVSIVYLPGEPKCLICAAFVGAHSGTVKRRYTLPSCRPEALVRKIADWLESTVERTRQSPETSVGREPCQIR